MPAERLGRALGALGAREEREVHALERAGAGDAHLDRYAVNHLGAFTRGEHHQLADRKIRRRNSFTISAPTAPMPTTQQL